MEKKWWRSKTVWTAIIYGVVNIARAVGLPIPDAVPEAILALLFIFLRLGNGSKLIGKILGQ